jgi:hypothetical protein
MFICCFYSAISKYSYSRRLNSIRPGALVDASAEAKIVLQLNPFHRWIRFY